MAKWVRFGPLFFILIRWIQLCDKKEPDIRWLLWWNFIKVILKNVIILAKGSLNNIFQDSFNKILFQQFTHDRSYISHMLVEVLQILVH